MASASRFPGSAPPNLTGTDGNPNARIVLTCDPGGGYSGDPYRQIEHGVLRAAAAGERWRRVLAILPRNPPINNLDLSISKRVPLHGRSQFEFRVDMFNALNHTQFTGVNATANFASLTDQTITNLPYDASGKLTQPNGFGTINGVAPPRTLQLVTRVTF